MIFFIRWNDKTILCFVYELNGLFRMSSLYHTESQSKSSETLPICLYTAAPSERKSHTFKSV